jgi:RNA polymerase sigma factor (sigma-70 family)
MPEESFDKLLEQINSRDPEEAWGVFLDKYSTTILQVVRYIERDSDSVPDCFQFVCERLSANSFLRLRKFQPQGPAVFSTWLRAVVRNLCLDWRRKQFGRHRSFRSISRLSVFDQEVFRQLHERHASFDETVQSLRSAFPDITHAQLAESRARIEQALSPRQRRLLDARLLKRASQATGSFDEITTAKVNVADPAPDPEAQALFKDRATALRRAVGCLSPRERILIRLRFEQELTLEQVAKLLDLGNAQRVERQVKAVLEKLREELE